MKAFLAAFLMIAVLSMGAPYFFIGLDIYGHIFPFVGIGTKAGDGFFNFSLGTTYAEGAWALMTKAEYYWTYSGFEYGLAFSTIAAFPQEGEVSGASIDSENFLFLAGGKLGYVINVMGFDLDFGANFYVTLPFGATNELSGPIPFLWLSIGQPK